MQRPVLHHEAHGEHDKSESIVDQLRAHTAATNPVKQCQWPAIDDPYRVYATNGMIRGELPGELGWESKEMA